MNSFPNEHYALSLTDTLEIYPPVWVNETVNKKRSEQIINAYNGLYEIQFYIHAIVRKLQISHLLGTNDVIVPYLVEEYAKINYTLKKLVERLRKLLQYDGDLDNTIQKMIDSFDVKSISSRLYDDLKHLSDHHGVEVDLKECMTSFKNFTPSDDLKKLV